MHSHDRLTPRQLLRESPERLTIAGDWHANGAWAQSAIRAAADAGSRVLLHLGDFGVWPGEFGRRYLDTVERALSDHGVTLAFVDGNHEDFAQLLAIPVAGSDEDGTAGLRVVRPGLYHLPRGTRWTWGGLRWLAVGGAISIDRAWRRPGISWWPEEALTLGDIRRAVEPGPVDVLLTHDCPAGIPIPGLEPSPGQPVVWPAAALEAARDNRQVLREILDAVVPTHVFHGHFHIPYTTEILLAAGERVAVRGLGRETDPGNLRHLDLATLARDSHERRTAGSSDSSVARG